MKYLSLLSILSTTNAVILTSTASSYKCPDAVVEGKESASWGHVYLPGQLEDIEFYAARFSGKFPCNGKRFVFADPIDGCSELQNDPSELKDSFVIVERGECAFTEKFERVKQKQALGAVLVNNENALFKLEAPGNKELANFPTIMVRPRSGQILKRFIDDSIASGIVPRGKVVGQVQLDSQSGDSVVECGACAEVDTDTPDADTFDVDYSKLDGGAIKFGQNHEYSFLAPDFGAPLLLKHGLKLFAAEPLTGCTPLLNEEMIQGNVVYMKRGECTFVDKLKNAKAAGANMVVFGNLENVPISTPGCLPEQLRILADTYEEATVLPSIILSEFGSKAIEKEFGPQMKNVVSVQLVQKDVSIEDFAVFEHLYDVTAWSELLDTRLKEKEQYMSQAVKTHSIERMLLIEKLFDQADMHYSQSGSTTGLPSN